MDQLVDHDGQAKYETTATIMVVLMEQMVVGKIRLFNK